MGYNGDQITWNRLSPSLKEKIDGGGGDELSKYTVIDSKGVDDLPSTYPEGLSMMRPTGEVAKAWYAKTVKTPTWNEARDILVVLTNVVDGMVVEQYIQHKSYASSGTEKFESSILNIFLRNSNKRAENPASPHLSWQGAVKVYPLPIVPAINNINAMWRLHAYNDEVQSSGGKFPTIAFMNDWEAIQEMNFQTQPTAISFNQSNKLVSDGRSGYDIISVGSGYTYEVVADINMAGIDGNIFTFRIDQFTSVQDAKDLNYNASVDYKVYTFGQTASSNNLPAIMTGRSNAQMVIPLFGRHNQERHLVISVVDFRSLDVEIGEGILTFKLLRNGVNIL